MSASNEYWTYHLTGAGWIEGTVKLDSGKTERPIPSGTILTLVFHESLSSIYSAADRYIEKSVFGSEEKIKALKEKHGERPKDMSWFKESR